MDPWIGLCLSEASPDINASIGETTTSYSDITVRMQAIFSKIWNQIIDTPWKPKYINTENKMGCERVLIIIFVNGISCLYPVVKSFPTGKRKVSLPVRN